MSLAEYTVEGAVARIALNRPPVNALNGELIADIGAAVAMAEADLKRKQEIFSRMPDNTTKYDAKRAEAVFEIAKLHEEITNEKESSLSSMMYLQWQIETLRNQLLELQLKVNLSR